MSWLILLLSGALEAVWAASLHRAFQASGRKRLAPAALFLARAGHTVEVFERVAEPGPVGAGITLQPTGQAVMALVDDASFYIQAYFEETKLPRIRLGAPVKVWLMGAGQALDGTVESISRGITDRNASPDAQLLADVEPTFNWVRLAQRIPVRIRLDRVPDDVLLSAGMTASVQVVSDDASAGE